MEYIALLVILIVLATATYTLYLYGTLHEIADIIAYEKLRKKINFWRAVTLIMVGIFIAVMCGVSP